MLAATKELLHAEHAWIQQSKHRFEVDLAQRPNAEMVAATLARVPADEVMAWCDRGEAIYELRDPGLDILETLAECDGFIDLSLELINFAADCRRNDKGSAVR